MHKIPRGSAGLRTLALWALVSIALGGCAARPSLEELQATPAPHLQPGAPTGIREGRGAFRRLFCRALGNGSAAHDRACDGWLHDLGDEPPADAAPDPVSRLPFDVVFVSGAFSECFGDDARPFHSAIGELSDTPHSFATIVVGGRSGAGFNARQIANYFDEHPRKPGRLRVLVGYSKGTTDILRFLDDYPQHRQGIHAVVSIAGSVYGTPLADLYDGPYHLLFGHLPMNRCGKGDGQVVHSLRTDVRREWLDTVELPPNIRYYSLAAFTTRQRLARVLVPAWRLLLRHNRRNDGQVLAADALIPGSTLLGYLNADHWAVAMEIENELEFFAHRRDPAPFPHAALLRAILDYVALDTGVLPAGARMPSGRSTSARS